MKRTREEDEQEQQANDYMSELWVSCTREADVFKSTEVSPEILTSLEALQRDPISKNFYSDVAKRFDDLERQEEAYNKNELPGLLSHDLFLCYLKRVVNVDQSYRNKFDVVNHMLVVNLTWGCSNALFDIRALGYHLKGKSIVTSEKTPRLLLYLENSSVTGNLSSTGSLNMVGGCTRQELIYALVQFMVYIREGLVAACGSSIQTPPGLYIDSIKPVNYVVSSKTPYAKINIFGAQELAHKLGIRCSYIPENANVLSFCPLWLYSQSIHARIHPTGGVVCTGAKSRLLACISVHLVCTFIDAFIVRKSKSEQDIQRWLARRVVDMQTRQKQKFEKARKKRLQWTQSGTSSAKKRKKSNPATDNDIKENGTSE